MDFYKQYLFLKIMYEFSIYFITENANIAL